MIKTHYEAVRVLGVRPSATLQEIKSAYKSRVKHFHPDNNASGNQEAYIMVKEAYEFLCDELSKGGIPAATTLGPSPTAWSNSKIMGDASPRPHKDNPRFTRTPSKAEHDAWEKKYKKRQAAKQKEFEQKSQKFSEENQRSEEEYKRAMDAIEAWRAARALEAWIAAYDKEHGLD